MDIKMELRPATEAERVFSYTLEKENGADAECIGHLRGDFGSGGESFHSTWFDTHTEQKTPAFREEFDAVVNNLRFHVAFDGILMSRESARKYGYAHPDSIMEGNYTTEFAFRVDTKERAYILRVNPNKGDYNFYMYAYEKKLLEPRVQAEAARLQKELRERPVYYPDYEYANKHDEIKQYRLSSKTNQACKRAIEKAISDNYDGTRLAEVSAAQVLNVYGFERTMCVLAHTIRRKQWDGRISSANKSWAATIPLPPDQVMDACCVNSHPGLLDLFVDEVRHRHLLTLPLTEADIKTEAERILSGFRSTEEPNSPSGTHFQVKLSDDFAARANSRQMTKLSKYLPFKSFALSSVKDQKGRYATISADEDRSKPLREVKPRKKGPVL